ncbi:hypothetical protein B0H15DRAFT_1023093, partial [Mycena belliarum]
MTSRRRTSSWSSTRHSTAGTTRSPSTSAGAGSPRASSTRASQIPIARKSAPTARAACVLCCHRARSARAQAAVRSCAKMVRRARGEHWQH